MIHKVYNTKGVTFDVYYDSLDEEFIQKGIYVAVLKYRNGTIHKQVRVFSKNSIEGCGTNLARNLLEVKDRHLWVDHIDGNPLNNQRSNLRIVTPQKNNLNVKFDKSQYKGVTEKIEDKCFFVNIRGCDRKSFDNNYDAFIYAHKYKSENDWEYRRDKRTLLEIAEDIPYKSYKRVIKDMEKGNYCDKCDKMIKSRFHEHYEKCTNLICMKCGAKFSTQGKRDRHIRENCSDKECSRCYQNFPNIQELRTHIKVCEVKSFKCPHCSKTFMHKSSIPKHIREKHIVRAIDN